MLKFNHPSFLIILIISFFKTFAFAVNPQVTYQGRILTAAGDAVTRPVTFKLQIRSPGSEDCIMYEETQSQDLTNTNGIFSLALNGPNSTRTDGGSYSFSRIFANRGTFTFASDLCASGVNYVTAQTDNRNLKVFFNDGSGWENLPLQSINPVPLAIEAMQVGGFKAASLLRVEDNGVLGNVAPLSTAYFNELISIITGVSTQYTKTSSNGTVVIPQANSPADLAAGQLWYDSGTLKYYNGITTVTLNSSGSSITTSQLPMGTVSDTVAAGNDSRIVNAIQNSGFAKSIQVGADSNLPSGQLLGRFYVASDSQKIYYDNGTVWITVAQGNALAGVTSATVINALGYEPLHPSNNLSDLGSSATARTNLGLGSLSTLGYIDLSSSYASGTLSVLRLPSFVGDLSSSAGTNILTLNDVGSGVVSGSQYTKVTVDGKGRVTSGANISSSDVTSALGFTPANQANTGITFLNGSSATTQTFATGSSGTSFGVVSSNGAHTFNIPLASASSVTAGLLSNTDYVTFQNKLEATSASVITALGYTPVNSGTVGVLAWLSTLDLGSSVVSGILPVASLSDVGAGVTSGTQYTKVTVDGKGRVTSGASLSSSDVTTALGFTPSNSANAGIHTLNGSSATAQTFATGSGGTSFGVSSANGVHTFNIPLASASSVTAGLLSNTDYVTFQNKLEATSSSVITALGYTPVNSGTVGAFAWLNVLDLGSSLVSGTLSVARLPAFTGDVTSVSGTNIVTLTDVGSGVTSGAQYTKVTVDSKGRVTSGASLSSSDVTAALGFTPSNSASAGIHTLNGSSATTQIFATGTNGTSFTLSSANGIHTFNIPLASASSVTAGLLSNSDYVTFQNKLEATSSSVITALGYTPVNSGTVGALAWLSQLDLGSSLVSGTLSVTRLPAFAGDVTSSSGANILTLNDIGSGVTSGSQYTKVTVDGKGRITSGASLSSSDVTSALGYTPLNSTSGVTSINGSTSQTQTFATGTNGTSFTLSSANGVHTFNIPLASASSVTAGLLSNTDYVTFQNKLEATSSSVITALGYTPVNSGTVGAFAWLNILDLGSSLVSGTLSVARLPAFTGDVTSVSGSNIVTLNDIGSGVTSGTQYTKVTVDGKGRVTSGASLSSSDVTAALGYTPSNSASAGIHTLNGSSATTQTFAAGTNGTSFGISSSNGTHTFNIPLASASSVTAGLLSNIDYVTFQNKLEATSSSVITALGYTPVNSGTIGALAWLNNLDLGSSYASGTLSIARLPAFAGDVTSTSGTNVITLNDVGAGVTSGTQYTKVTVDSKGRVTSGANLSISDVTSALGYTPAYATSATQWTTTGSDIYYANGKVAIGATTPTALLQLGSGTSTVAPFKFTSGTLLASPSSGSLEYDGFNIYYTDGSNARRTLASVDSTGTQNNTSVISNSGNITLAPIGSVIVSSTTASTSSDNGALVVKGGVGVTGNINASGTITTSSNIQGASITATNGVSTTVINGAPYLALNPSGGNVGVGITNSTYPFQVYAASGSIAGFGPSTFVNQYISVRTGGLGAGYFGLDTSLNSGNGGYVLQAGQQKSLGFLAGVDTFGGNTPQMTLTGSGSVGIGTVSPSARLTVLSTGATSAAALMHLINGASSTVMYARNDGYIGIGTTAPTAPFHVYSSSASSLIFERNSSANANIQYKNTGGSMYAGLSPSSNFGIGATQNLDTNPTATFTPAGKVGIGTTAPTVRLDVSGTIVGRTVANATTTIDFATANLQYTTSDCTTFNLAYMKDGGSYAFAVQGTNSAVCAFNAYSGASGTGALTVHMPPDHGASMAGTHTLYNFIVMGTHVYVSWTKGY